MPAPKAAPDVKLYDRASGKATAFKTPEDATQAYVAGTAAPKLSDTIPVALADGQIGTVSGSDLAATIAAGGRIAAPQELRHAELAAKYGDGGSTIAAGLVGAARGATLGLSDVALTGIAGGIGGQQGADEMRERLEAYRELHPIASTGGELAGIGATMLIPGLGEANAARGAVEGGLLARGLVGAADAATAIPRGVTALGGLAERGATRLLTEGGVTLGEGASLGERILAHGVQTGARGAAEGAVYGAGSEVSEATLGNKDLTAEQLFAGMSHGALFGGVAGGALGAAAPLARAGAERFAPLVVPKLEGLAEEQAARALNARKPFIAEMERIPGGVKGVGRELLDSGLLQPFDTLEQISPRVAKARTEAGEAIGRILDTADAAGFEGPKVDEVVKRIRAEVLPHLEKMGNTNRGAIRAVEDVIADFENFAGAKAGELPPLPTKPKLEDFERAIAPKNARDAIIAKTQASLVGTTDAAAAYQTALREYEQAVALHNAAASPRVTFRDLQGWRAQLDDQIKFNASQYGPINERTEAFKGIRNAIEKELLDAGEKAAAERGGSFRKEYEEAKLRYRRLAVADKAASDALERMNANQSHSLTDKIFGAAGATVGFATHGPLGAATGLLAQHGSKIVRERANATAAVVLDKFSVFRAVRNQQQRVNQEVDHAVSKFFGEKVAKAPEALPASKEAPAREYERRVQEVAAAAGDKDRAQATALAKVSALAEHAPELRRAVAETSMRAIAYLESHIPPGRLEGPSATPHLDPPAPVSTIVQQQFLDRARTVDNPASALRDFAAGRASREQVEALRVVYPQIYGQLEKGVKAKLQSATKPPPYQKILQLSSVLGQTLDRSQQPQFVTALQAADKAPPAPKLPPPPKSGALPKSFSNYQTTTQRIEGR